MTLSRSIIWAVRLESLVRLPSPLNLDPGNYPYDKISVPGEYIVDFNGRGFVVDFAPASK